MADLREMGNMKSFGLSGREGLVCFEGQGRRVGRRTEADQPEGHAESTDITMLFGGYFGTA